MPSQNAEPSLAYHVEHIVARQHGRNRRQRKPGFRLLPLQCAQGLNLSGLDPETGALVRLFHPRQDQWDEHFEGRGFAHSRSAVRAILDRRCGASR
jgi:hypothetical protein